MNKGKSVALWTIQTILAVSLLWSAWMKLFTPVIELAKMWPWAGEVPINFLKFTGIVDLLGALGLLLPGILNIRPRLISITALGVGLLMICAIILHVSRGEANVIVVNLVFLVLATIVWWYRRM